MSDISNTTKLINEFLNERRNEKEGIIGVFDVSEYLTDILTEDTIIKPDVSNKISKENIGIAVMGDGEHDRGFGNDPYFKVFSGKTFGSSPKNKKVRISIFRPEYIEHNGETWNLNSSMKKALIKVLQYKLTEDKTVWDEILRQCVVLSKSNLTDDQKNKILSASMPDYTKLVDIK